MARVVPVALREEANQVPVNQLKVDKVNRLQDLRVKVLRGLVVRVVLVVQEAVGPASTSTTC